MKTYFQTLYMKEKLDAAVCVYYEAPHCKLMAAAKCTRTAAHNKGLSPPYTKS
jgi:hypothetical protein